jgi:hypothetical protein
MPKHWIIINIQCGSSLKSEDVHCAPAVKTYGIKDKKCSFKNAL